MINKKIIPLFSTGYSKLKSFQQGGNLDNTSDERMEELLPYFALLYSQELNKERYGPAAEAEDMDAWISLLKEYPEDEKVIVDEAKKLTSDQWDEIAELYEQAKQDKQSKSTSGPSSKQTLYAKKGASLKKLRDFDSKKVEVDKKGGAVKKATKSKSSKKCSCGCNMILKKAQGGHLTSACACGCKISKNQEGTVIEKTPIIAVPTKKEVRKEKRLLKREERKTWPKNPNKVY